MAETSKVQASQQRSRGFILGNLSFGHGVSHMYDFGLLALMPTISSALGLSNIQVGALLAARAIGSGVVNVGGGPLVDLMKRHWGRILTWCMIGTAISFALIGGSPNFTLLIVAMLLVSIPGTLWHLPAGAALSQRFPERRGFAMGTHTFGGSVGNALGPQVAKGLLRLLAWRNVFFIYVGPALLMAIFVWWALRDLGREARQEDRREVGSQFRGYLMLLKNPIFVGIIAAATIRAVSLEALFNWTPFYLENTLGMGHIRSGLHFSLLTGLGIVSISLLGAMSDRFGRKQVLVPGLIASVILSMWVVSAGDGALLVPLLAGLGLLSFALHPILQAAALDQAGRGMEATTIGVMFGLGGFFGGLSPFLGAVIIDHLGGYGSMFYYSGILTAITAGIIIAVPLADSRNAGPTED